IDDMRNQLTLRKLEDALLVTTVVAPKEVEDEFAHKYEKAKVEYIAFPPAKFRDAIKPTPEQVRTQFDRTRARRTMPEKNTYDVGVLDQAKVETPIVTPDPHLRQAYAGSMENSRRPERAHPRHILIKADTTMNDAQKAAAKKKAEDILKQVKGGA